MSFLLLRLLRAAFFLAVVLLVGSQLHPGAKKVKEKSRKRKSFLMVVGRGGQWGVEI